MRREKLARRFVPGTRAWFIALAVLLFLITLALLACNAAENDKPDAGESATRPGNGEASTPGAIKPVSVRVQRVEPTTIRDILVLPGQTEAIQDVALAAEHAGQVEWVGPAEGQPVTKGELIAKIDAAALEAELGRAKASLALAEDQARRRQLLFDGHVLSREELDESLTQRTLAKGTAREVQVNYEKGMVRSPIDGVVNTWHVDPGEYVAVGDPLAVLVNVSRVHIKVNVPELDVRYLAPGQPVFVTVDAYPGDTWTGSIEFVAFKADSATKTFLVKVLVDNADSRIRPGMIARAAFLRRAIEGAITAPLFSVVDKGGERVVFVEVDGKAQARTVSLGVLEQERVQLTDGVKLGENLIVSGQTEVEDGMRVQVQ